MPRASRNRSKRDDHKIAKGLLAGAIGGLVASYAMNQFQVGLKKVEDAWGKSAHQPSDTPQSLKPTEDSEDATMKTADRIAMLVTRRHLSREQKKKAGPV